MVFQVFTINAKQIVFIADRVESDETKHVFYIDDEIIGEFQRNNIAGYMSCEEEEDEEDEY